jgi:sortase (surface protein transpeptidase)
VISGDPTTAVALWRARRRWLWPVVAGLVAAVVLGGAGWWATTAGPLAHWRADPPSTWHDSASSGQPQYVGTTGDWAGAPPPSRVRIPKIGVDSPLDPLSLDLRGALETPTNFDHAGWYDDGTPPGEPGPAVIVGHVDSASGPAVFQLLHQLAAGDVVEVARGERWVKFHVVSSEWYPKAHFPTAHVYGPTPDAQLRLITCGGEFDRTRRSYVDNLVVFAVGS